MQQNELFLYFAAVISRSIKMSNELWMKFFLFFSFLFFCLARKSVGANDRDSSSAFGWERGREQLLGRVSDAAVRSQEVQFAKHGVGTSKGLLAWTDQVKTSATLLCNFVKLTSWIEQNWAELSRIEQNWSSKEGQVINVISCNRAQI